MGITSMLGNYQLVLLVCPFCFPLSIGEVIDKNLVKHVFVLLGTSHYFS